MPSAFLIFDLVARQPGGSVSGAPLHRICTLMRKMGAKTLLIECGLHREDVRRELEDIANWAPGEIKGQAKVFSFFATQVSGDSVADANSDCLLGQAVVINYRSARMNGWASYVYDAVVRSPHRLLPPRNGRRIPLLNMFIPATATYPVQGAGREFTVQGVYYCQQNGKTSSCAHACLRMLLNTIKLNGDLITTRDINNILEIKWAFWLFGNRSHY